MTDLQRDSAQLASQLKEAQRQITESQPRIDAKIAEVSRALESLDKASRRSDADLGVQFQKTLEDMAQLRGMVETYQHRLEDLETGLGKLQEGTDQRFTALQGADAVKAAEAKKKADSLQKPQNPKDFLALAQQKLEEKDVALARGLFTEFLRKWPKDAQAAEAHFRLGETYSQEQKWREALFEYGKVMQDFPSAPRAPEAYLRSADSFKHLGMAAESRLALEELIKAYAKSEAAKTARARLLELDKAKKPASPKPAPGPGPAVKPAPGPGPAGKKGK